MENVKKIFLFLVILITCVSCVSSKQDNRGVLLGTTYSIDAPKIGLNYYKLVVYTYGVAQNFKELFLKYILGNPSIVNYSLCIGEWDFELGVHLPRHADALELSEEIQHRFQRNIQLIKVIPVIRETYPKNFLKML